MHCASNLRQIGQAIQLYCQDFKAYPPDLRAVVQTQQISTEVFTCTSSSDVKAPSAAALGSSGTCSYIYVGASLPLNVPPDAIVILEDPANHDMDGSNVLYADGHVVWVDFPNLAQALSDLQQGTNPPSATPALTSSQAKKLYNTKWKPLMPSLKSGVWRIPTTAPARP